MWKGVDCLRQRQQPGREYEIAKRQKEHSTGQSLQSERGVSAEAIGSQKGRRCIWIRVITGIPECEQQKSLVVLKKEKDVL